MGGDPTLFGMVLKHLSKRHRERGCEPDGMNKMIRLLWEIEETFKKLPVVPKVKKARRT